MGDRGENISRFLTRGVRISGGQAWTTTGTMWRLLAYRKYNCQATLALQTLVDLLLLWLHQWLSKKSRCQDWFVKVSPVMCFKYNASATLVLDIAHETNFNIQNKYCSFCFIFINTSNKNTWTYYLTKVIGLAIKMTWDNCLRHHRTLWFWLLW